MGVFKTIVSVEVGDILPLTLRIGTNLPKRERSAVAILLLESKIMIRNIKPRNISISLLDDIAVEIRPIIDDQR